MRRKRYKIFSSLLAVITMFTMFFTQSVFALSTDEETWLDEAILSASSSGLATTEAWLNSYLTVDSSLAVSGSGPILVKGTTPIYLVSGKTEDELSGEIQARLQNADVVNNVDEITDGLQIEADTQGAASMISGFVPLINIVIGILLYIIIIGTTIYSALDILYMTYPLFRSKCETAKASGDNKFLIKQSSTGENSYRFISDDAVQAIKEKEVSGKNQYFIYLKLRLISLILVGIIVYILFSGNLQLIINIVLRFVAGIMDVLSGLQS